MGMNIQLYNKPLIARPGQPLEDHLKEVREYGIKLIPSNFYANDLYKKIIEGGLLFHDIGKAEISIQEALYKNTKPPLSHTHLSVIFFFSWIQDLIKKDLLELLEDRIIRTIAFVILSHHSPPHKELERNIFSQLFNESITIAKEIFEILENYGFSVEEKTFFETFEKFVGGYKNNICEFINEYYLKNDLRKHFVVFYNALVKSDWYSAMGEQMINSPIDPSLFSSIIEPERSEVHAYIFNEKKVNENILLELPTGFGKTFLGIGFALKTNRKKIIYTLPVTTIIEDVYDNLQMKLGEKAKDYIEWYTSKYITLTSLKKSVDEREFMGAKYFEKPLVITTLDQILLAFLSIDRYPLKEFATYDSCLILDEPQLYSPLMLFLFAEFLKDYKDDMSVIIMTATLPKFLKEKIQDLFNEPFRDMKKNIFSRFNRTHIETSTYLGIPTKDILNELSKEVKNYVKKGEKVGIIFNTVEKAQSFYQMLAKDIPKFLFHARYIYRDRVNKLNQLKNAIKSPLAVVSTQVIEAGVNISFDVMFRELAPLDSIIQSAGRVNRFTKSLDSCPVFIFGMPKDYLPYNKYQVEITKDILCQSTTYKEIDYFDLLQEYWENMKNYLIKDEKQAKEIHRSVKTISPFCLNIEESKINLRDTYIKISVIPIKYYQVVKELLKKYEETDKKRYWERKKIFADIESYMTEVPYWNSIKDKNFRDFIFDDEGIKFITLKYDEILGLIPEEDISYQSL